MKKTISAVLAVILTIATVISLAACGNKKDQIQIAIPNDTTNEARALLLLQDLGIIKLKDGAGITATVLDIAENPHNIKFTYKLQWGYINSKPLSFPTCLKTLTML